MGSPTTSSHELFHLIQFGIFIPDDGWLLESTAEWMGFRFEGFPTGVALSLGAPDMSLDCIGDKCGNDVYETGGYSRWSFFEYVGERYGGTFVKDVFDDGATLGDPAIPGITLIGDAITAKGDSLSGVVTDWTVANLTGNYTATGLKGVLPQVAASPVFAGKATGVLPTQTVSVNHLAAKYLAFIRGDGTSNTACYAATLTLSVSFPAGLGVKPYFYWSGAVGSAVPLTLGSNSASITVPWDTCAWSDGGYLLLQNPSTSADAQVFTVAGSIHVDKTTPAVAADPPDPASIWGTVVPASGVDFAPTLIVHAPELLRVSSRSRVLRLIVYSSGDGSLRAGLASLDLGTRTLRAGNNDVRFVLPKSFVTSRRSTKASSLLRLTSVSPQGADGSTVTRRVVVQKPKRR